MTQRMSTSYYSPLISCQDDHPVDYFSKVNQGKRRPQRGDEASSPWPALGRNMRPVHLRALTSNTDGEGGLFLLEDLDVSDLYQLEHGTIHKQSSGSEPENRRCLPLIPAKRMPVHPRSNHSFQQPSVHLTGRIHNHALPNHLRLANKASDRVTERTGKLALMGKKCFRNRKIQVSSLPQDFQKIPQAAGHSDARITMLYLGRGLKIPAQSVQPRDELKVFQQICGAENICVYKGHLTQREKFQFSSRRHRGFPFSATIYINGMAAARISWCCEHRYHSSFQQGSRSCFRVLCVQGGMPCYRCLLAQQYQKHRSNQTIEQICPGRKGDPHFEDKRTENGLIPRSEFNSFRSSGECERDGKITVNSRPSSNSDHQVLKAKETPLCSGGDRVNTNLLYTGMKQCPHGWVLRETLKVNNPLQNLDSDSEDVSGKEQGLMRKTFGNKLCPRADNTECSSQASAGNDENASREQLRNQEGDWRKDCCGADRDYIDQESGSSNDSGRDRSIRRKVRKKKVRRLQARVNAEAEDEKFSDPVSKDVRKTWAKTRRQKKINFLKGGHMTSVIQHRAVEDVQRCHSQITPWDQIIDYLIDDTMKKYPPGDKAGSKCSFWKNEAESLDNNPNCMEEGTKIVQDTEKVFGDVTQGGDSIVNHEKMGMKEKTDITQKLSINKSTDQKLDNYFSGELKEGHTEVKVQGSGGDIAERLDDMNNQQTNIHHTTGKELEVACCVREKLALALQSTTECVWSEPELSETSETSRSEDGQESEEEANSPAQGGMSIDEIGLLSLLKRNDPGSVAGWKDGDGVVMVTSVQQINTKVYNRTNPHSVQTGSQLETSSPDPKDVVACSSTNSLQEGCEPGHMSGIRSDTKGNEDIGGEPIPKQKIQDPENTEVHHCLKTPVEMFANPTSVIKPKEGEGKQTLPSNQSNFQPLDNLTCINDTDREHHQPVCYNMELRNGHTLSREVMAKAEGKGAGTEQLLAYPTLENKEEEETTLIVSSWSQQAAGTLRKQIIDTVTVLWACKSVGQLIVRNTGLTDDLLEMLVSTLVSNSESEVETINLNLNNLGPFSAQLLVELLKAKPSVKCLLLYGNKLGDKGVSILMDGLIDLFLAEKAEQVRVSIPLGEQHKERLQLMELDIGSNQLTNEGLKSVARFLRLNPPLEYLGLSQNAAVGFTSWCELFDILKDKGAISHLLLDENGLGNEGAKRLADALYVNGSLCKIDLDWNEIGDEGGLALAEALASNPHRSLVHLSLDGNKLSTGVKKELNALITENNQKSPTLCLS
ncbi:glutamate-rich protein 3-like [Stegostoma tigrinum]|uniref:glutamate-rich protein 3-like n=1 Tax=Stegostoma tigrinum TaxID=3053191 RepID=UPI0028708804|nr:glutamate-rich protein 3-like [Stegostoma tigrinum]